MNTAAYCVEHLPSPRRVANITYQYVSYPVRSMPKYLGFIRRLRRDFKIKAKQGYEQRKQENLRVLYLALHDPQTFAQPAIHLPKVVEVGLFAQSQDDIGFLKKIDSSASWGDSFNGPSRAMLHSCLLDNTAISHSMRVRTENALMFGRFTLQTLNAFDKAMNMPKMQHHLRPRWWKHPLGPVERLDINLEAKAQEMDRSGRYQDQPWARDALKHLAYLSEEVEEARKVYRSLSRLHFTKQGWKYVRYARSRLDSLADRLAFTANLIAGKESTLANVRSMVHSC